MRSKVFVLEREEVAKFFAIADREAIDLEMAEVNEQGDLVVQVNYEKKEREAVMSLVELVDDHYDDIEGEEED